jgi:Arc/MetJ-type ribon-helix-helix transcriptional regulator
VKLSVSLPEDDIAFLDEYTTSHGVPSRSAALQQAVALLRAHELSDSYADAWAEWGPEAQVWEPTVADGLDVR